MKTSSIVSLTIIGACMACSEQPPTSQPGPRAPNDAGADDNSEQRRDAATELSYSDAATTIEGARLDANAADVRATDVLAPNVDEPLELDTATPDAGGKTTRASFGMTPRNTAPGSGGNPPMLDAGVNVLETNDEDPLPPLGTRNFACQPSKSPMFQSREPLEMWISGDFTRVNNEPDRDNATSPGLIDPDGSGPLDAVPVEIRARGRLRYLSCGYRPFKVVFEEKQKGNVFHKLGKSVKFSTHCGDRQDMDPVLAAPSLEEYYQRVRMEHTAYQIVDTLDTLSLETRLVKLTYHDTATDTDETHLAFVREPEDEMAERCDMLEGEDIPSDPPLGANRRAELLLFLVNNFILQSDVKNKLELRSLDGKESVLAPYDFDLLGIFRRDFFKLKGRTLEENNAAFADWLRRNQSPELFEEVALILGRRDSMQAVIDQAGLNATNRRLFDEWLALFTTTLLDFQACGDPTAANDVACHVPDDHANTLGEANSTEAGEHHVWLEPPGDKDFVGVALESNQLYSFVTRTPARILAPEGDEIRTVPAAVWGQVDTTFSLVAKQTAAHYVEFDRGDSLVCSDMWANDLNAQYHAWALYADDHANMPELATSLAPAATTNGTWELDTLLDVFDEDWFRVEVTDGTKLTLRFRGNGAGSVESFEVNAPHSSVGFVDLFPPVAESTDLVELFPAPGAYFVRVLQSFGDGTYTLETH